jgi:hypothetical protein
MNITPQETDRSVKKSTGRVMRYKFLYEIGWLPKRTAVYGSKRNQYCRGRYDNAHDVSFM